MKRGRIFFDCLGGKAHKSRKGVIAAKLFSELLLMFNSSMCLSLNI